MQKPKIYNLIAVGVLFVAAAASWFAPRIPIGKSKPLDVAGFPRVIGDWKAVEDKPQDPGMKAELPSATIVERIYRRPGGHDVDLLLLTASDPQDFHDPTVCLPSQGWETLSNSTMQLDSNQIHVIQAKLDNRAINMMYWQAGDYASTQAKSSTLKALYRLRSRVVMNEEGTCLLVRVITDGSPVGQQESVKFVDAIDPNLSALMSTRGPTVAER